MVHIQVFATNYCAVQSLVKLEIILTARCIILWFTMADQIQGVIC